jgi:hypothetical protein
MCKISINTPGVDMWIPSVRGERTKYDKTKCGVAPEFEPKTSVVTTSTYKPPELNMFPAASETAILLY